jgi:hypothetical protein
VSESADLRQFIHEITLRMERVLLAQIEARAKEAEGWNARFERTFQDHERMWRELSDLREESQAQRGALLALIDEIRGGGAAPAT